MTMTRSLSDQNKICQFRPYVKFTDGTNCTERADNLPFGEIDGPKPYFYGPLQCGCIGQPSEKTALWMSIKREIVTASQMNT